MNDIMVFKSKMFHTYHYTPPTQQKKTYCHLIENFSGRLHSVLSVQQSQILSKPVSYLQIH